jgi:hypothetical protein
MKNSGSAVDALSGLEALPATGRPERHLRLALAIAWTIVIMVVCWLPRQVVLKVEGDGTFFRLPNIDKVVHSGIFVLFAILWVRAVPMIKRRWIVAFGFALMVVTELVQELPAVGRDATLGDAAADTLGAVIGVLMVPYIEPWMIRWDQWFIAWAGRLVGRPVTALGSTRDE